MADREQVQVLLRDLGGLVGLPELGLDADGHCSLVFDGRVEVDLAYAEGDDRLTVAALLGRLPADAPAERYLELLDANFFWRGTEGATLGVERDSGTVVLLEALPLAGLDIGGLDRAMESLAGEGDQTNAKRTKLAQALAEALRLWERAQGLASSARGLSLEPESVVFELCGMLAALAPAREGVRG